MRKSQSNHRNIIHLRLSSALHPIFDGLLQDLFLLIHRKGMNLEEKFPKASGEKLFPFGATQLILKTIREQIEGSRFEDQIICME